jgi:hypothetical protein
MGTMLGNVFGLAFIVASALVGFISLEASSVTFIVISYLIWLIVLLSDFFTRPSKEAPLCQNMLLTEIEAYRKYHLHFWDSGAAEAYSSLMNALRMAGFVWGGICLWNGLYWLAGAAIAYFFITGFLILKLNPWLYMGAQAQSGNPVAIEELSLIENIQEKRAAYNAEPSGD